MEGVTRRERRVMVAFDEHEGSFYALEWALKNLHESIVNSHFIVFTAQPSSEYSYIRAIEPRELRREVEEDQKKTAVSLLENAREICSKYGAETNDPLFYCSLLDTLIRITGMIHINPEAITEVGDPKDAMRDAVEKNNIHLLIVGSHGVGALKRILLKLPCLEDRFLVLKRLPDRLTLAFPSMGGFLGSVSNYCGCTMSSAQFL